MIFDAHMNNKMCEPIIVWNWWIYVLQVRSLSTNHAQIALMHAKQVIGSCTQAFTHSRWRQQARVRCQLRIMISV